MRNIVLICILVIYSYSQDLNSYLKERINITKKIGVYNLQEFINYSSDLNKKCDSKDIKCKNNITIKYAKSLEKDIRAYIQNKINDLYNNPEELIKAADLLKTPLLRLYQIYIYDENLLPHDKKFKDSLFQDIISFLNTKVQKKEPPKDFMDKLFLLEGDNSLNKNILDSLLETYKNGNTNAAITELIYYLHFTNNTAQCIPNYSFEKKWQGDMLVGTYGGYSSSFIIRYLCETPKNESLLFENKKGDNPFKEYYNSFGLVLGDPGAHICGGSMEYLKYASKIISLKNYEYLNDEYIKEYSIEEETINQTSKYFKYWSAQGLWNYNIYNKIVELTPKAEKYLQEHYIKKGLDPKKALIYAKFILNDIMYSNTGIISESTYNLTKNEIYKTFFNKNVNVEDLKNINELNQNDLNLALKYALISEASKEVIESLIKKGANINTGDESALFFALNNSENVELLIKNGADVNYENSFKKTPVMAAIQSNNINSIKILVDNGADLNKETISVQGYPNDDYNKECMNVGSTYSALKYALSQSDYKTIMYMIKNYNNIFRNHPNVIDFLKNRDDIDNKVILEVSELLE